MSRHEFIAAQAVEGVLALALALTTSEDNSLHDHNHAHARKIQPLFLLCQRVR